MIPLIIYILSVLILLVIQRLQRIKLYDDWMIIWTPVANTVIVIILAILFVWYIFEKIKE